MDEIPSKIDLTDIPNVSYQSPSITIPDSPADSPVLPMNIKADKVESLYQENVGQDKLQTAFHYSPLKEETGDHGLGDTSMYDEDDVDDENTPLVHHKSDVSNLLEKAVNQSQATPLSSAYNFLPPLGVDERQFINQTAPHFKTSTQRYTQVLIWCLVKRTQRASTPNPRKSEVMKGVYEKFKRKLASNEVKPRIHTPSMAPLKPRVANPENNHLRSIIKDLTVFKRQLQDETAEQVYAPEHIPYYEPDRVLTNPHEEDQLQAEVNELRTKMDDAVGGATDTLLRVDELSASATRVLHRIAERHTRTRTEYLSHLMTQHP